MLFKILGISSALIFLAGDTPYLLNSLGAKTKPHRVTWGIVTILNAISFMNQYASGASNSLWLYGAGTLMTGAIFLSSIKNGVGGKRNSDIVCLVIAFIGIVLWVTLKSPLYSILANAIASIAALWPTIKKSRKSPLSETRISWLVGGFSSLLAAISVGKLDFRLLVLPGLSVVLQGYIVYLLYVVARQRKT